MIIVRENMREDGKIINLFILDYFLIYDFLNNFFL